jgi:hypothetical protein
MPRASGRPPPARHAAADAVVAHSVFSRSATQLRVMELFAPSLAGHRPGRPRHSWLSLS